MPGNRAPYRFLLFGSLAVLLVDRLTKWLALQYLAGIPTLPVLPGFFHLTLVYNTGVAFGLLQGKGLLVTAATLGIVLALVRGGLRRPGGPQGMFLWGLALILGGALGNLVDRIFLGAVIDFLDFRVWPVFNLADSSITIGAALMAWTMLRRGAG